ncbi:MULTISPECIES: hypothetical protein [unclassified Herbaspirillum]|uniref:hypothetical protein n=1 Tax=unclassified Herbaspirillum TaxID=2624150 RepID=UPI000E2E9B7C|nr:MULTISPECIES: hypothetical protein [unclassified Herbaspirillum]RFB69906.1 hypothetical protein DZB54_14820 [Herbaspirillum sp. 3R-3a1]TFI07029.1 hypothetical protein E4P32_13980 [Herbaspirillum sp. 3R11]TFI12967.1 hypothetical protein E4P31_19105 [Herbaspirillum sp. 3R-11]TFI19208.1 hypothetical protein E4P30_25190 [Herbaspirillum sp. 3C11]
MSEFYIASTRHTRRDAPYITFWGPNDSSYKWPLSWAGKYSRERIQGHLGYYSSGESTFAVPCAAVEAMAVPPKPRTVDGDAGPVVPNTTPNRQALTEACAFPTCKPIEFEWFSRKKGRLGKDIYNCAGCGRFVGDNQRFTSNCANCGTDNRP